MKTSEQIDLISTALSAAQGEFPVIEKTRINPHFKSKFANLSDILSACVPVLSKHGLSFSQGLSFVEGRLVITARLLHKSGQWIETELSIRPMKDDAQAIGSASTYGRRYTAEALLGVSATEDDDGNAASDPRKKDQETEEEQEQTYFGSAQQQASLRILTNELGINDAAEIAQIHRSVQGMPISHIRAFVSKFKAGGKK